jgi:DNA polymerase-3 subunit gamma/tau
VADVAPDDQPTGDREPDAFVSLYRRFRPGRFDELRGQPHVVRALQGAVRDGRVAHAYLFSGPRGTGKTSAARILAKALNCTSAKDGEPCGTCASCLDIARGSSFDVHELDAASNNGVDAMRDLIAHAALATPGRWKVYIVDEVHMLSNAAANALLKTLEEPPGHVVFVLATTDPQKVPPTIRSRTQHFEFGLLSADVLGALLHDVNDAAALGLEEADLSVAVRKGRGSARDALSALDQVVASGTAEALRPDVTELTGALAAEDARTALVGVASLHDAGWGPQQIATELVDDLRQSFLVALAPELCTATGSERERLATSAANLGLARLVRAMETVGRAQVDMREAPDARAVLEVALARLARPDLDESTAALADRVGRVEQALADRPPPVPAPPPPPAPTGPPLERPGLGAYRRQRAAGTAPAATAPPPAAPVPARGANVTGHDAPPPAVGAREPAVPASATEEHEHRDATESTGPDAPPGRSAPEASPSATARAREDAPDRDAVVEAWGDHILRALPARAKAVYSAGRFVSMDGATATFALPNAAHRDRCEDVRNMVEKAISDHFSTRVALRLVIDEGQGSATSPAPRTGAPGAAGSPAAGEGVVDEGFGLDPDDEIDPALPSGSHAAAHAFVLEAFPGAEEVRG